MRSAKRKKPDVNDTVKTAIVRLAHLPTEVQARIIEFACRLPHSSANNTAATAKTGQPAPHTSVGSPLSSRTLSLDAQTTLSLTLTSRGLHAHATPFLYGHVHLNRPSSLRSFQTALSGRPQLGRFVKSLHIGPDQEDDHVGTVCSPVEAYAVKPSRLVLDRLATTLCSPKERQLRPQWAQDVDGFPLHVMEAPDCRSLAVQAAIAAAQAAINVNLKYSRRDYQGRQISEEEWTVRMFEAQALLDLYLIAARQLEDKDENFAASWRATPLSKRLRVPRSCQSGTCAHYPALLVTESSAPQLQAISAERKDFVVVTRSQLLEHLARPGSACDSFDHPVLWIRSGRTYADLHGQGRSGAAAPASHYVQSLLMQNEKTSTGGAREVIGAQSPSTATTASLLELTRSVLALTPRLANLSLTGFLEGALCGQHTPPRLPALRSVSLGPPPPFWTAPLRLERLEGVEKLRLCGVMLYKEEISTIVQLPGLKHFEWAMAEKFSDRHPISLFDSVDALWGRTKPSSSQGEGVRLGCSGQTDVQKKTQQHEVRNDSLSQAQLPLVKLQLHYDDVTALHRRDPTDQLRDSWLSNNAVADGTSCRLLVQEGLAASLGARRKIPLGGISKGWKVLYEEGRDWWNQEARM